MDVCTFDHSIVEKVYINVFVWVRVPSECNMSCVLTLSVSSGMWKVCVYEYIPMFVKDSMLTLVVIDLNEDTSLICWEIYVRYKIVSLFIVECVNVTSS